MAAVVQQTKLGGSDPLASSNHSSKSETGASWKDKLALPEKDNRVKTAVSTECHCDRTVMFRLAFNSKTCMSAECHCSLAASFWLFAKTSKTRTKFTFTITRVYHYFTKNSNNNELQITTMLIYY